MKIFVFGSNGMLGRYVSTYFKLNGYDVIGLSRKEITITDITEVELHAKLFHIGLKEGDVVINCIGTIKQRKDVDDIIFIYINSIFPRILANVCEKMNVNMIHPTTDCVYDGLKGRYTETDLHNATDVYGKTKSLGEANNATVIRTSIIGEEIGQSRSLVEWVKSNKDKTVNGYTNHYWNGVTCLEFAVICQTIIDKNLYWKGVRHIFSPTKVSKYELVKMISDIYELNITVNPFTPDVPCYRDINSINKTDIDIPELFEQIKQMKEYYTILVNTK